MVLWIARIVAGFILAIVAWFNWQPWIEVGYWVAEGGMELPFGQALFNMWIFGGVFEFIWVHTASVIAVCLWLVVQTLQVMALLAESDNARKQFSLIFKGFPLNSWVTTNAEDLKYLGWAAYGVEAFVCFLVYVPYGRGMEDFVADLFMWDSDIWDFWAVLTICITVLMFEAAVMMVCFFSGLFTQPKQHQAQRGQP